MSVNVEEAKSVIRDVLLDAKREGRSVIHSARVIIRSLLMVLDGSLMTVRIALQKAEQRMDLPENELMEGKHKKVLKAYIKEQSVRSLPLL